MEHPRRHCGPIDMSLSYSLYFVACTRRSVWNIRTGWMLISGTAFVLRTQSHRATESPSHRVTDSSLVANSPSCVSAS